MTAASAVALSILAKAASSVVRSTNVLTANALRALLIRSLSLCRGRVADDSCALGAGRRSTRYAINRAVWREAQCRCVIAGLESGFIRIHPAQYACDLLQGIVLPQQALDMPSQRTILGQARWAERRSVQRIGTLLVKRRSVAARHWRMPPLPWRRGLP